MTALATGVLITPHATYQLTLFRDALVYQRAWLTDGHIVTIPTFEPNAVAMTGFCHHAMLYRAGTWNILNLKRLHNAFANAVTVAPLDMVAESAGAS